MGAAKNSQSWLRAVPPTNRAGPKLLAGFTEVPVMGMLTKCISTKLNPMEMPAKPLGALSLVEPKITSKNMKVKTTSAAKAETIENVVN